MDLEDIKGTNHIGGRHW